VSVRGWCRGIVVVACGWALVTPALAQQRQAAAAPSKADPQEKARFEIAVMESVLETAVQRGGMQMTRQWRSAAPEMLLVGGAARARGFRLDGYGVFFVVDVPALSRTVVWTWRMMDRESGVAEADVQSLRKLVGGVTDPGQRKEFEQAIRRIEAKVAPLSRLVDPNAGAAGTARPGAATSAAVAMPGAPAAPPLDMTTDPNEAYTTVVKDALIDAMLDHSQALQVSPDESLTVAARDNTARSIDGDDAGDAMTIFIRIKGSDLQALRAGRLTREEARKRVEIREY